MRVRSSRAASAPRAPSTRVASASGQSQASAVSASSPAWAPKIRLYTRTMEYTPTLVMMANSAATGALAAL